MVSSIGEQVLPLWVEQNVIAERRKALQAATEALIDKVRPPERYIETTVESTIVELPSPTVVTFDWKDVRKLNDADFVRHCYNRLLGRAPDEIGFSSWMVALGSGSPREELLFGIENSDEFRALNKNLVIQKRLAVSHKVRNFWIVKAILGRWG